MARLPSCETALTSAAGAALLDIADSTVLAGLDGLGPGIPDLDELAEPLRVRAGVFVTLLVGGELNGCIGSIEGTEPLGQAAARHAWSAAFADPRLPVLTISDYPGLTIEVSVLTPLLRIGSDTRQDVLERLRPGEDGLVLEQGPHRALFLPSVWAQLPDPVRFVDHLLHKAGMRPGSWPRGMRAWCFTTQTFSRAAGRRAEATKPDSPH